MLVTLTTGVNFTNILSLTDKFILSNSVNLNFKHKKIIIFAQKATFKMLVKSTPGNKHNFLITNLTKVDSNGSSNARTSTSYNNNFGFHDLEDRKKQTILNFFNETIHSV